MCLSHSGFRGQTLSRRVAGSFCTDSKELAPFFARSLVDVFDDDRVQGSCKEVGSIIIGVKQGVEASISSWPHSIASDSLQTHLYSSSSFRSSHHLHLQIRQHNNPGYLKYRKTTPYLAVIKASDNPDESVDAGRRGPPCNTVPWIEPTAFTPQNISQLRRLLSLRKSRCLRERRALQGRWRCHPRCARAREWQERARRLVNLYA